LLGWRGIGDVGCIREILGLGIQGMGVKGRDREVLNGVETWIWSCTSISRSQDTIAVEIFR
jgi:hypothetical protein